MNINKQTLYGVIQRNDMQNKLLQIWSNNIICLHDLYFFSKLQADYCQSKKFYIRISSGVMDSQTIGIDS